MTTGRFSANPSSLPSNQEVNITQLITRSKKYCFDLLTASNEDEAIRNVNNASE